MKIRKGLELDPRGPMSWNMDEWVGAPAIPFVKEFNTSPFFGTLKAMDGAFEAVSKLYSAGNELHVISSCSSDPWVKKNRVQNLDRIFGDVFSSIVCLELGVSKLQALNLIIKKITKIDQRSIFIEDNYNNALTGCLAGYESFCLRRQHNQSSYPTESTIRWIDDFQPIIAELSTRSEAA